MKFFKTKAGKVISVVVIFALIMSIITRVGGENPVSNIVRTVFAPFQSGVSYISEKIGNAVEFVYEMKGYREENARLVEENIELKKKVRDDEEYHKEIDELRALLELKKSVLDYKSTAARIIGHGANNYYDKLEINKGTLSGIKEGDVVITPEGLVGQISEAGLNHAIVTTIIADKNATGIRISRTGDIGVIEGDSSLSTKTNCKLTFVDKNVNIITGDILETSGSGGIYPEGIAIGIIRDINMDNLGMLSFATVEPSVNFRDMHEVLVIHK